MRNAHRPRTLPNKKLPRGIERQDELIELIERRFHQEDLIRNAINELTSADDSTEPASESDASAEKETPSTGETIAHDDKTAITTGEAPSADDSTAGETTDDDTIAKDSTAPDAVTIRWHGRYETITDPLVWLTVFDTVREAGDAVTREIADRRFHGESYWKTCDALYLSTGTYYHHVRAILHYAFACAVYHRLIDPRPKLHRPKAK